MEMRLPPIFIPPIKLFLKFRHSSTAVKQKKISKQQKIAMDGA